MPYVSVAVALLATTPTPPAVSADPSTPKPTLVVPTTPLPLGPWPVMPLPSVDVPTMPLPQATVASMAPTWLPELPIVLLTTRVVPENLAVNVVVASTASLTAPCTTGSPALIASPRFADRLCRTVLPNSLGGRPPQEQKRIRYCRDGVEVASVVLGEVGELLGIDARPSRSTRTLPATGTATALLPPPHPRPIRLPCCDGPANRSGTGGRPTPLPAARPTPPRRGDGTGGRGVQPEPPCRVTGRATHRGWRAARQRANGLAGRPAR